MSTFYRCGLCRAKGALKEFGSLSAWYKHLAKVHPEFEPEWARVMRLEGRKPPLWQVLRDSEAAGFVERFKAKACCGRCLYYDFGELKCWKRPQAVIITPVNTAVCPDFTWREEVNEIVAWLLHIDGLERAKRARKAPIPAVARGEKA